MYHQNKTNNIHKTLILLGGGHANLFVLEALINKKFNHVRIVLVTPSTQLYYSGIYPSILSGHIDKDYLTIDIDSLIKNSQIELIIDTAVKIDADAKQVHTSKHGLLKYDWVSVNTGAMPKNPWQNGCDAIKGVKPIEGFVTFIDQLKQTDMDDKTITIVGGGAAAVEIAFACRFLFKNTQINLLSKHLLSNLSGHQQKIGHLLQQQISSNHINWLPYKLMTVFNEKNTKQNLLILKLDNDDNITTNYLFVAIGSTAPKWIQSSQLAKSEDGFIQVNQYHQSLSHPEVFAVGDICDRQDVALPKAGVYAVRAGEVLAKNMLAILQMADALDESSTSGIDSPPLIAYQPKKEVLQILALGRKFAIAIYGRYIVSGYWVWQLKKYIDTRFIKRFQKS